MTAKKEPKKGIAALLEEEAEAIDADRDAPITDSTTVTRGHGRSKTLQIRLNPEELEELERVAATRGLPTSTVAREAVLRLIRPVEARAAAASRLVADFGHYLDTFEENSSNYRAIRERLRSFFPEHDPAVVPLPFCFDVAYPDPELRAKLSAAFTNPGLGANLVLLLADRCVRDDEGARSEQPDAPEATSRA